MLKMKPTVNKGDIYWVEVNNGSDRNISRPMLVISNDAYNNTSNTPIGFLLTRSESKMNNGYHYVIEMEDGQSSGVNLSQIYTVHKSNFKNKVQEIDVAIVDDVIEKFKEVIVIGY